MPFVRILSLTFVASLLAMAGFVIPATAAPTFAATATTLYDNNFSAGVAQANSGSLVCCTNSQDQSADFPNDTAQAADDFTVPVGQQWSVSEIDVAGSYYVPFGYYATSVSITIYTDNSGEPGSVVSAQTGLAPTGGTVTSANFSVPISAVSLNSGTYWLSVQAVGSNFRWYWDDTVAGSGSQHAAEWQQPGQSDVVGCASWSDRATCVDDVSNPDQAFRIVGVMTVGLTDVANGTGSATEWHPPSGSSFYLGTFNSADCVATPSSYSATIDWMGTGTGSSAGTIATASVAHGHAGACNFDVFGSYTYYDEAIYRPAVTVTETSTLAITTLSPAITVDDLALQANNGTAGQACTVLNACSITAASFTDTNNSGTGLSSNPGTYCNGEGEALGYHYNVSVYFGDGTSAANNLPNTGPVTLSEAGSSCVFTVSAVHSYTSTGPYTVTTTVCEEGGAPCITTSGPSLSSVSVGVPPSHVPGGFLSALSVQYSYVTQYQNYTLQLAEYLYRSGTNIENTNFTDSAHGTALSYCATRNAGLSQCRAHVLSFTCTATHATIYASYQQPYTTDSHTYEVQAFMPKDPANPYYATNLSHATNISWFIVTIDNGAGSVTTTSPPIPPLGRAVSIRC